MSRDNLCDGNCNECPIILHPNSRMVSAVLNTLLLQAEDDVTFYKTVNDLCPNFTVCYDCRIDDFCHEEEDEEGNRCAPIEAAVDYYKKNKESKTLIQELNEITEQIEDLNKRVEYIKEQLNKVQD